MFFDSRPNLGVLVGLCVVGTVNARWRWRYRVSGARASLTRSQTLLGLLNLLCSLACVYCGVLLLLTVTWNWSTAVVGVLWVRLHWKKIALVLSTQCLVPSAANKDMIGHGIAAAVVLLDGDRE